MRTISMCGKELVIAFGMIFSYWKWYTWEGEFHTRSLPAKATEGLAKWGIFPSITPTFDFEWPARVMKTTSQEV